MRCHAVVPLEVEMEGETYGPDSTEDILVEVEAGKGVLLAVCAECVTPREAVEKLAQTAARALDLAEQELAWLQMVYDRIPDAKDNPRFKQRHATAQAHADRWRGVLAGIMEAEIPEDDE
jgi:hypothetical protein